MDRSNKGIRVECAGPFFYIETMYKTKWREVKGMVFGTDLTGKMAVVTGAGGILCGMFARTLACLLYTSTMLEENPPDAIVYQIVERDLTRIPQDVEKMLPPLDAE